MRRLPIALAATFVFVALCGAALAENTERPDPGDCDESGLQVTLCMRRRYEIADDRMNSLYRQIRGRIRESEVSDLLLRSQRRFLAYREATCAFERSSVRGGTLEAQRDLSCMARLTEERNRQLQEYLSCKADDCPGAH